MTTHSCDVAVVGCGPAGIAAAVSAAAAGARVVVVDEAPAPGGQIWRQSHGTTLPATARYWMRRFTEASIGGSITLLSRAAVVDHRPGAAHMLTVQHADGAVAAVYAPAVIVASGARERLLPFPGWTLPGVFGVGGVQALLKAGMQVKGKRVVVAGTGPLLLPVAASLARAGAQVVEVAEQAPLRSVAGFTAGLWRWPGHVLHAAACRMAFRGTPYRTGTWVTRAVAGSRGGIANGAAGARPGERRHDVVTAALLTDGQHSRTVACDMLCVGYLLVPCLELPRLAGCVLDENHVAVDEEQRTSVPGVFCAGEPTSIGGVGAAIVEGRIAGAAAAGTEPAPRLLRERDRYAAFASAMQSAFALRAELRGTLEDETIVCRCEDVPHSALRACGNAREAKLATRAGMGACQARVCGPAMSYLYGWSADSVRPPILPATITALTGPAASE